MEVFQIFCKKVLNYHAPCKQKYAQGNHLPFMNKTISKEIMKRTRLRNRFLKDRNDYNKREFSKQRNYCLSLLRKSKKAYYSNPDEKKVTDNKTFWKAIKPFLSDKIVSREKLTLIEEYEIVESDINTAQILNTFFSNIVSNLKIAEYANCDPISDKINNPVIKSIGKYRSHTSMLKKGEVCTRNQCSLFSFLHVYKDQILKEILSLDSVKASQDTDICTKIIKGNADIFSDFLLSGFNNSITTFVFPSSLKQAIITPVFVSKIFERFLFKQISDFMEPFFSKQQCGFRKGYSTQYCVFSLFSCS